MSQVTPNSTVRRLQSAINRSTDLFERSTSTDCTTLYGVHKYRSSAAARLEGGGVWPVDKRAQQIDSQHILQTGAQNASVVPSSAEGNKQKVEAWAALEIERFICSCEGRRSFIRVSNRRPNFPLFLERNSSVSIPQVENSRSKSWDAADMRHDALHFRNADHQAPAHRLPFLSLGQSSVVLGVGDSVPSVHRLSLAMLNRPAIHPPTHPTHRLDTSSSVCNTIHSHHHPPQISLLPSPSSPLQPP